MNRFISIGKLCKILGISLSTAYRWLKAGTLVPAFLTYGGHRRFSEEDVYAQFVHKPALNKLRIVTYARVSSADQKNDLEVQSDKLKQYVEDNYACSDVIHITDLGSGLNYKKKGLLQLLNLIWNKQVDILVLNHKDRLLRFGAELVFKFCSLSHVKVIVVETPKDILSFEQELAQDVIELMTVFCARLYGKRSHKNKVRINS